MSKIETEVGIYFNRYVAKKRGLRLNLKNNFYSDFLIEE